MNEYLHGGYSWKQAIDIVEKYNDSVQTEFFTNFLTSKDKPSPYRRMKNPEMDILIADGLIVEYPDKETPKYKTVRLIEDFMKDKRKVHWYFLRKFRKPNVFNGDFMEYEPLPDDEITAYLHQRGFCLDVPIKEKEDFQ